MDMTPASEAGNPGSTPGESTKKSQLTSIYMSVDNPFNNPPPETPKPEEKKLEQPKRRWPLSEFSGVN